MQAQVLPLFPLSVVVFPRTPLPLHIFEARYKEMIGEAIRNRSEFGIVLAKEEGIASAGCSVRVDQVLKEYEDGRLDIRTIGVRRFHVLRVDREGSFLRADVEFFDDEDPEPASDALRVQALEEYRRFLELELPRPFGDPQLTDPQLSFQLAHGLPDLDFLHMLLRDRSEGSRLRQVTQFFTSYIPKVRETERMQKLAPLNGHGRSVPKL
ncbi:MAG: LON peptidase substrate-binding domain-containing protein [Bryobacteraceae bacterium]